MPPQRRQRRLERWKSRWIRVIWLAGPPVMRHYQYVAGGLAHSVGSHVRHDFDPGNDGWETGPLAQEAKPESEEVGKTETPAGAEEPVDGEAAAEGEAGDASGEAWSLPSAKPPLLSMCGSHTTKSSELASTQSQSTFATLALSLG